MACAMACPTRQCSGNGACRRNGKFLAGTRTQSWYKVLLHEISALARGFHASFHRHRIFRPILHNQSCCSDSTTATMAAQDHVVDPLDTESQEQALVTEFLETIKPKEGCFCVVCKLGKHGAALEDFWEYTQPCIVPSCDACNKEGECFACSKCCAAFYCSKQCQKKAWKESHKEECDTHKEDCKETGREVVAVMLNRDFSSTIRGEYLEKLDCLEKYRQVEKTQ